MSVQSSNTERIHRQRMAMDLDPGGLVNIAYRWNPPYPRKLQGSIRYHTGDEDVWSVVRIPSTGAEDRRHLHRDRWTLSSERTKHINRIKGLLAAQGIGLSVNGSLPEKIDQVRTWDGSPLPQGLKTRLLPEHERLQLVEQQMKAIEQEQRQAIRNPDHPSITMVRGLMRLKSIHIHTA